LDQTSGPAPPFASFSARHLLTVHNLQADPRVRVKADGAWRTGTAAVLPGDDAVARSRMLPYQRDAAIGRMTASAQLTIRIDLDPAP
jgi:F420H(2)-dependent quinone reductase